MEGSIGASDPLSGIPRVAGWYVPGHVGSRPDLDPRWQHGAGRPAGARLAINLDLTRSFVPNHDVYFARAGWRWRLSQGDGHDRGDHARYREAQDDWPQHGAIVASACNGRGIGG